VASTLSGAIASNLTTACDTLLPLVTTQNVSLAIAGTAGVLAAVGCRKAVRFWRGTARKGEAVKGATQDLEKVTEEKRKIDALIEVRRRHLWAHVCGESLGDVPLRVRPKRGRHPCDRRRMAS